MAKSKKEPAAQDLPTLSSLACVNAARSTIAAYDRWLHSDGPNASWRGMVTKAISQELHLAIQTGCDATADAGIAIEPAARLIVLIFDDLAEAFTRWIQEASLNLDTAPPRGNSEIHSAMERLRATLKSVELPKPDPVKQLIELQRVSPQQVAMIYGWKLDDGSADTQKVFEELQQPGKHYQPETWVHPALKAQQLEVDSQWSKRTSQRATMFMDAQSDDTNSDAGQARLEAMIASGQVDEMFAAGATVKQMVNYLKIDEEMLMMLADDRGYIVMNDQFVSQARLQQDQAADNFKAVVG